MKKSKVIDLIIKLLMLATVGLAYYFYQVLPDEVITHWNGAGQPDDWGSKMFHILFTPLLMIAVWILFMYLPKLDPKRRNYDDFMPTYKIIQLVIIGFFFVLFVITSLVNMDYNIPIGMVIPFMVGILFIIMGVYMKDIKPNLFVGIRTPWTLSSDEVWQRTHKYGGKAFMIGGVMFLAIPFFPPGMFVYAFILAILAILSSLVYSYFVYKSIKKGPEGDRDL